jgi:hypothetical protein
MPEPIRRWAEVFRELAHSAGEPSVRELSKKLHCSASTLSRYLRGERLRTAWSTTVALVKLVEARHLPHRDIDELARLHQAALQADDDRADNERAGDESKSTDEPTAPEITVHKRRGRITLLAVGAILVISGTIVWFVFLGRPSYNSQQLLFYDNSADHRIHSLKIIGINQNGDRIRLCFRVSITTNPTAIHNWWWAGHTDVYTYSDPNCADQPQHLVIDVPTAFDGFYWYCLVDTPPSHHGSSCAGPVISAQSAEFRHRLYVGGNWHGRSN